MTTAREIAVVVNRANIVQYGGNLESSNTNTNANVFTAKGFAPRPKKDNKKTKINRFVITIRKQDTQLISASNLLAILTGMIL